MRIGLAPLYNLQLQKIAKTKLPLEQTLIDGVLVEFLKISNGKLTLGSGKVNDPAIKQSEHIDELIIEGTVKIDEENFSISQVSNFAFYKANISRIIFKGEIEKIGVSAFEGSNLIEVEFQNNSFSEIPLKCFCDSTKLEKLTFNSSIKYVMEKTFYQCPITYFNF